MLTLTPSPSLADLTTLRIGGSALAEIRLTEAADFDELPAALEKVGGTPFVLGGGSNLLVAEGELPVVLVRSLCGAERKPEVAGENVVGEEADGAQRIRVGAGLRMPTLLGWCAEHGLSGLEGLIGVPGRVGGAVAMNAGAYGCSMGPLLRKLTVFTPERGVHELGPAGWTAGYRHFALNEECAWFVVIAAELALPMVGGEKVKAAMMTNLTSKKTTQPLAEHTAGCVFKNPSGLSAGKLLDEAGMRGRREGSVRFTEKHANFLAHDRKAGAQGDRGSFKAATALITEAREAVARKTGITLELEIKVWPCPLF